MNLFSIFKLRSINSLLITYIILFSSGITILTTAVQLIMDYRRDISLIQQHFKEIEISYINSLKASLWVMDLDQVTLMINGISRLRDIQYVAVEKDGIDILSTGEKKEHRIIEKKYALSRRYEGQNVDLGSLSVAATLDGVYRRLLNKVFVILVANAVKTFSVALFFFYIFNHLVKRHLNKIADYTRRLSPINPSNKLLLDRNRPPDFHPDELDLVVNAINEMQHNLKKSYESLSESEERFRNVVQTATDAIISVDFDGYIITWNRSAENMFGYSEDEALGMPVFNIMPEKYHDDHTRAIKSHIQSDPKNIVEKTEEMKGLRKNGQIFPVEISLAAWKTGGHKRFSAIIRETTVRKKFEARLQQSQKMESIGTLAGGVAHEINNPINGIMNYAQLIKDRIDADNPGAEFTDEIIHETKRVATIVRNLLTFAREEKESHSPARITDIVNDTMSLVHAVLRKDQISLNVDVSEDLPKIKCRSQQIQQVIMNLVTNARDALNQKYSEYDEKKVINISSTLIQKDGRRWIRTIIEDHGKGIPQGIRGRILDPFFTTKPKEKGTGLGLSISYGIVKNHHGELFFESETGQYTKFYMDLPVDDGWDLESNGNGENEELKS